MPNKRTITGTPSIVAAGGNDVTSALAVVAISYNLFSVRNLSKKPLFHGSNRNSTRAG